MQRTQQQVRDTGQSCLGAAQQPTLGVSVSVNPAVPASRTVFRLSLCLEDTCSKLNRPQPDRGEQVTGGSTEHGHVCIPSQPTGTALLLFPEEFVCSSSNGSAYVFKDKGKVRPQLVDLPGEAYEAVALRGCTTCHRWQNALVYWSDDIVLTGHWQGNHGTCTALARPA